MLAFLKFEKFEKILSNIRLIREIRGKKTNEWIKIIPSFLSFFIIHDLSFCVFPRFLRALLN